MPDYIFDTTVLSNLAAVNGFELLETRYRGVAFTTLEVSNELWKGINSGYAYLESVAQQIKSVDPDGWLQVLTPQSTTEYHLRAEFDHVLDPGEASCLALAVSRGLTLVTDDLAARRLARERKVALTGTLGILVALVRSGALVLAEANAMLADMIQKRYRSPVERLDELV